MNEQARLRFEDLRQIVAKRLGSESWLTVYEYTESADQTVGYFCALVKPEAVERCYDNTSWDLLVGHGAPGFIFYSNGTRRYYRFGEDEGIEPFVFCRDFHGLKPDYIEISEEFRHFHNLYEDRKKGVFLALNDNGDDVEVVRTAPTKVQVRAKYLKDYLAARKMCLLLFFEFDRYSPKTLVQLGLQEENERQREANYSYVRFIAPWPASADAGRKTFGRITGKKLVVGSRNYRPSFGWEKGAKTYEQFIIGIDDDGDGDEILHTCDDEQLANYFGKNPDAPHYLTPVFFSKEVLGKYYAEPAKYRVEDGHLYCGSLWGLRLDNNHPDYVVVFLGDLGHLSHKEQLYWRSYNVAPDGGLSEVAFRRAILGQFTDPDEPALAFKSAYSQCRQAWRQAFGWELFKPLSAEDQHHWHALHVPAGENQKDFDEQVMSLAKLLVERLNEAELANRGRVDQGDKGITKLGKYLDHVGFPKDQLVTFLRNLNGLRSGPAHVKGADYRRAAQHFDLAGKGLVQAFADILTEATFLMIQLQDLTTDPAEARRPGPDRSEPQPGAQP